MKITRGGYELRAHDAGASIRPESGNSGDLSHVVARMHPAEVTAPPAQGVALTNVVAFTRHRPDAAGSHTAPQITVGPAERSAAVPLERHRAFRWAMLLLVSLAAHICLYLPFGREPTPMTSLGEISMSVELVLGAQTPAGLAAQPDASETPVPQQALEPVVEPPAPERETSPPDVLQTEPTPADTPPPVTEPPPPTEPPAPVEEPPPIEPPARTQQTAPEPEAPPPPAVEASPPPPVAIEVPQQAPAAPAATPPEPPPAPAVPTMQVVPLPKPTAAPPQAAPAAKKPPPERPRADRPKPETRDAAARADRSEARTRPPAASAASGVGRGRSEANTNYRGIVAAHLARYKQFPPQARERGNQGSAVVTFALNGGGRVTSVSLSRGTGVGELDQEAVAMVRRASPFPAPPDGRGVSFTVPVSFRLQ